MRGGFFLLWLASITGSGRGDRDFMLFADHSIGSIGLEVYILKIVLKTALTNATYGSIAAGKRLINSGIARIATPKVTRLSHIVFD